MARASARYDLTAKDRASAAVKSFSGNLQDADKLVLKLTGGMSLLGAANVGVFAAIYKAQAPVIDQLAKTADKLGITTEALQAMQDAGERAGISNSNLNISLQRMTRRVAEAANGTGEAVKALDKIGLSAKELVKLSPDQQFAAISKELEGIGNQSEKVALAFKFFDSGGVDLVRLTGNAVAEARAEMELLGISISRLDAAKIESANDAFQRIGRNITGVQQKMTVAMAPAIQTIATAFNVMAANAGGWGEVTTNASLSIVKAFGYIGDFTDDISIGFGTLELRARQVALAMKEATAATLLFADDAVKTKLEREILTERGLLGVLENSLKDRKQATIDNPFSQQVEDIYNKAVADAEKAAKRITEQNNVITGSTLNLPTGTSNAASKPQKKTTIEGVDADQAVIDFQAYRERITSEYEKLADAYKSDEQLIIESFEAKRLATEEFAALGAEQALAANDTFFAIEEEKQRRLTEIELAGLSEREKFTRLSYQNKAKTIFGELAAITQGVAQNNKALFAINKIAGVANAGIAAHEGAAMSLAKYSMPLAGIMAAAHYAAGLARVNAIAGASYGSKPSSAGTLAPAPSTVGTSVASDSSGNTSTIPQTPTQTIIQMVITRGWQDEKEAMARGLQELSNDDDIAFNLDDGFTTTKRQVA